MTNNTRVYPTLRPLLVTPFHITALGLSALCSFAAVNPKTAAAVLEILLMEVVQQRMSTALP